MPGSTQDPEWRLRTFRPGDEAGVAALFERGYGRRIEQRAWRWKYRQRTPPVANVWLAVDAADRPVFHYAGVPRRLVLAGETRDAMVTFDAVTDPRFRRRGIFTAGMSASHEAWSEAGFACILGLPNERWGSRVQALDWRPLFPLRWQIRPLRPELLLARRLGAPVLGRLTFLGRLFGWLWDPRPSPAIEIREAVRAGEELAGVWEMCRLDGKMGLVRDRDWLDWRYFSCPEHRYRALAARRSGRITGYLIYRFDAEHRYGFIAELLARPEDEAGRQALLGAALKRLAGRGAVAAAALAVPGTELHRSLRRAGFLLSWGEFTVRCVPLAGDLPLAALRDHRRWVMSGGDFDVI